MLMKKKVEQYKENKRLNFQLNFLTQKRDNEKYELFISLVKRKDFDIDLNSSLRKFFIELKNLKRIDIIRINDLLNMIYKMLERKEVNILHLSDLHFGKEYIKTIPQSDLDKRDTTLKKLIENLKTISEENKDWKPDIIAISGDIGYAGKKEDYLLAKKWLINLLSELNLEGKNLIMSPGNHDRYVEDIMNNRKYPMDMEDSDKNWYEYESESFKERFKEFIGFSKDFALPLKLKDEDSYLSGYRDIQGIRFVVLNSARYAYGGEKDKGRLYLGWPDVNNLVGDNILINPDKYNESPIIISLFHHPDNWFDDSVTNEYSGHAATYNFLAKRCHIMISGHVHAEKIGPPKRIGDGATHFSVGASYLRQAYVNNCAILKLDLNHRILKRLPINFNSSEIEWIPDFDNIKEFYLGKEQILYTNTQIGAKEIKKKSNAQLESVRKKNLDKLIEKLPKIEKKFNDKTSNISGALEFQIKVVPKNLKSNLFDESQYSSLKEVLRSNTYGPSLITDSYKIIFDNLKVSREGLYSIITYSLDEIPMGGNIFIAKEGIIIFKWYYNEFRSNVQKNRFPKDYVSSFLLGFFDFLYVLFSNFDYSEGLKIIFSIDKLKGWIYTPMPDWLPVDYSCQTSSDYFEPYEFECEVNNLSLKSYKIELIKEKLMRQILLEMGYEEEFRINPEFF